MTLRQFPGVQHFHEQRDWTANGALARFPLADGAEVADAQTASKTGLGKTGPLTDGFEGVGSHLPDTHCVVLHHDLLDGDIGSGARGLRAVFGILPSLPVGSGAISYPSSLGSGLSLLGSFDLLPSPHGRGGVTCGHLHSPVPGGARPRVDEHEIGPMGRFVNGKMQALGNVFGGAA